MLNIGSVVKIQGTEYKIKGFATSKSFLLERTSDGREFKSSKAQIEKLTGEMVASVPKERNPYLGWPRETILREIQNFEDGLDSPENIFCDGEISHAQGMKKIAQMKKHIKWLKAAL